MKLISFQQFLTEDYQTARQDAYTVIDQMSDSQINSIQLLLSTGVHKFFENLKVHQTSLLENKENNQMVDYIKSEFMVDGESSFIVSVEKDVIPFLQFLAVGGLLLASVFEGFLENTKPEEIVQKFSQILDCFLVKLKTYDKEDSQTLLDAINSIVDMHLNKLFESNSSDHVINIASSTVIHGYLLGTFWSRFIRQLNYSD